MSKKILATSWHTGGINAIIPVIEQLRKENAADVITVGYQGSSDILSRRGILHKQIEDYGLSDISLNSMFTLLEKEKPDLILTGTSVQDAGNRDVIEQNITLAAKELRIPTVAVVDFWLKYSLCFDDIYTGEKFRFLPDRLAITDVYAQSKMISEGFPTERLVVTGNPHFDTLETKVSGFTAEKKNKILDATNLNSELYLFYAAGVPHTFKEKFGYWDLDNIQCINEVIQNTPKNKTGLIVKLHPSTSKKDEREIQEYIQNSTFGRARVLYGFDSQDIILSSAVTLTAFSTVGIEALYLRKPCIRMQPELRGADSLSFVNDVIPVGYTYNECRRLLLKAIFDDSYRTELVKKADSMKIDGKATDRVINLIYSMLR
jgi:hypothetical protein